MQWLLISLHEFVTLCGVFLCLWYRTVWGQKKLQLTPSVIYKQPLCILILTVSQTDVLWFCLCDMFEWIYPDFLSKLTLSFGFDVDYPFSFWDLLPVCFAAPRSHPHKLEQLRALGVIPAFGAFSSRCKINAACISFTLHLYLYPHCRPVSALGKHTTLIIFQNLEAFGGSFDNPNAPKTVLDLFVSYVTFSETIVFVHCCMPVWYVERKSSAARLRALICMNWLQSFIDSSDKYWLLR